MPYVCKLCGLVLGLGMILLAYFATLWSFSMIIEVNFAGSVYKSFKELYTKMGGKYLASLYDWTIVISLYGALVSYQIVIASIIQRIMINFEVENPDKYRLYHIMGVSIFAIFPLCLIRDVTNFRYIVVLSLFSLAYTTIITVIELPFFWKNNIASFDNMTWFKLDWSFFTAFGITFFCYMSQPNFYGAVEKLNHRDPVNIKRVIKFIIIDYYKITQYRYSSLCYHHCSRIYVYFR